MKNSDLLTTPFAFDVLPSDVMPPAPRRQRIAVVAHRYFTPERVFVGAAALYLLLSALSFFVVRPTTQLYFADYWEHRAIVQEIARHGTHLTDPIYGEAAMSRQFTPWSLALGYIARIAHLEVDTVMAWGAMAVSLLFVAGMHGFGRAYYRHRWAPAVLLACVTCAWGVPPLIWTGFHALRSQLHGNYYPAELVFALTFVAWGSAVRLLRRETFGAREALLLFALVAISFITHPLNAAFLVAGVFGLALFERGVAARRRVAVALVVLAGVGVTVLWPWFNPLSLASAGLARGQATFNNFAFFYDPAFVIAMAWPGIFAMLALPGLVDGGRVRMPFVALAATVAAFIVGALADVSVAHRLLAYIVLWLQLLMTRAALDVIDGQPPRLSDRLSPRAWRGIYAVLSLLIVVQVGLAVQQLTSPWADTGYPYPPYPVDADVQRVVATLPPGARVLGYDSASLVMPSHGVKVVAFPRPMPLSPSDAARQNAYRRFFMSGTPTCERLAIAWRWHATHIAYLALELGPPVPRQLAAIGPAYSPVAPWRIIPVPARPATNC